MRIPNTRYRIWRTGMIYLLAEDHVQCRWTGGLCYQTVNVISLSHRHLQANETALFDRDRTYICHDAPFLPSAEPDTEFGAKIINRSVSICIEVWRYRWQPQHSVPALVQSDAARRQSLRLCGDRTLHSADFVSTVCNEDICVALIMLRWLTGDSGTVIRKDLWKRRFASAWIYWRVENIRAGNR
jgi:hypothetical protein